MHFLSTGVSAAWEGLLVTDSVVFALTLFKAIQACKEGMGLLTYAIIHDGKAKAVQFHTIDV